MVSGTSLAADGGGIDRLAKALNLASGTLNRSAVPRVGVSDGLDTSPPFFLDFFAETGQDQDWSPQLCA